MGEKRPRNSGDLTLVGNSCSGGRYCVGTSAGRSLRLVNATRWTVEFRAGEAGGSLLQGVPITQAMYSIAVEDGSFPRHHMLPLHGEGGDQVVTVVTDEPATATVTVQVSQETADVGYRPAADLARPTSTDRIGYVGKGRRPRDGEPAARHAEGGEHRSAAELVRGERARSSRRLAGLR